MNVKTPTYSRLLKLKTNIVLKRGGKPLKWDLVMNAILDSVDEEKLYEECLKYDNTDKSMSHDEK